ncbi:MAG: long-chain-fatty-acid--CoA ligase [Deltaproteobacteria bacterium]|nr:long-chain-fatty-acid--CoA ligase [Deltaproteobacteria bacterium]
MAGSLGYGQTLALVARKYPNKIGFICGDKRYTYRQFDDRCNRLANVLLKLGLSKGHNIATLFVSRMELMESYYGITKMGGVVVPLNFRLAPGEYVNLISHADASAIIYEELFQPLIDVIRPQLGAVRNYICVGHKAEGIENYEDLVQNSSSNEPDVEICDDDNAFMLYTAGTTGAPKGVIRTHKNQFIGAVNFASLPVSVLGPDIVWLSCPPAFHCASQEAIHSIMFVGGTNILAPLYRGFDPTDVLKIIQEEKVVGAWAVPTMWMGLLGHSELDKYDLSSLRLVCNGGAIMPLPLKQEIMAKFPKVSFMDFFGMTEMNPWSCVLTGEDALRKPDSVGRPCVTVDIRIWNENCEEVPAGEVGEIVYSGLSVMKEYYKNPSATQAAMTAGYFHSGDLVRQDEEGFIYVVDRKKDMIISGGENVYPAEVEVVLLRHPKIQEAAVIGVPDPKWGESVKAIVKMKSDQAATEKDIIEYCRDNIAHYKAPKSVDFVTEFPVSSTGKVLKRELRKKYGPGY